MSQTTIVSLDDASKVLRQIDLKNVKDVRALDVDLLVVLANGDRIILSGGAVQALTQPNLPLEFANGAVTLGQLFQQVDLVNLSPEANLTAASREITRYNQNNARVKKSSEDEEAEDKPVVASPGDENAAYVSPNRSGAGNAAESEFPTIKSAESQDAMAAVEINSAREQNWSVIWPAAAGLLALVAGGSGSGSAAPVDPGVTPTFAKLSGLATLNSIDRATVVAYSESGELLGTASVSSGKFDLTLNRSSYTGVVMLVVSDDNNDPDNYTDEVTGQRMDVGVIRALAVATGADQQINVTALTELAVLKAGLKSGANSPAGVSADAVVRNNDAVANLFKVEDLLTSDPIATKDTNGDPNPAFATLSPAQQNYGAALHAISLLESNRGETTQQVLENLAAALRLSLEKGALVWNGSDLADELQSDLYSERSSDRAGQKIGGDYVELANYLETNKVAFALPTLLIKDADTSRTETWQRVEPNQTLMLDRGDFTSGSLAVRGPVGSVVTVRVLGKNASGTDIAPIDLGTVTVGANGLAVFRATDAPTLSALSQLNRNQKAQAVITISDGDNSRTNIGEWVPANVAVDFATVPVTRISSLSMVDTGYSGSPDTATEKGNTSFGENDTVTSSAGVTGRLTQSLRAASEKLQFSTDGGNTWIDPAGISWAENNTVFTVTGLSQVNQTTEVRARVVLFGRTFTGGLGNANEFSGVATYTLDTLAPNRVVFAIANGGDNGLSNTDLITVNAGQRINIASGLEISSSVTLRFLVGQGEGTGTLQRTRSGAVTTLNKGEWYTYVAGDQFTLLGDTIDGTGKIVLSTRQIDRAGNATSGTQTFVVDTRNVVDRAVALANASAAVKAAQDTLDQTPLTNTEARNAATRALEAAVAAERAAIVAARTGMLDPANANEIRLNQLGLQDASGNPLSVSPDTLRAVINALAATQDPNKVNTKPGLAAVVEKALADAAAALAVARDYADSTTPEPTLADFAKMGVEGVSATNLAVVLSALAALPADKSDTITEVQAAVDAYNKLLAMADGVGNTSAATTPADYAAIGVQPTLSAGAASLLGQVIDRKNRADIDTVAELNALANIVDRIAQQAALPEGTTTTPGLTPVDFEKLGIAGVNDDNLPEVLRAIARTSDTGSGVDTLAEVRDIVNAVIADLKYIIDYADTPEGPGSSTAPLLSHYRSGGLTAQQIGDGSGGSVNNLASINDAVKGLTGTDVGSWAKVTALANAYNAILNAADGRVNTDAASLPTAADYARIGVTHLDDTFPPVDGTPDPAKANALRLLNTVVDGTARTGVDTVAEVRQLASIAARVVQQAAGELITPPLTAAELNKLGISPAVTEASLPIVLAGIKGTADDGSGVTTPAQIADAAQAAQAAQDAITRYAADPTAPPPTLAQYQALGTDVKDQTTADAINSALASPNITPDKADTPAEVQALADAYAKVLNQAGDTAGTEPDPTPADYATLGADVPPTAVGNALLNTALAGKAPADVDTLDEVNALIDAANTIAEIAAGDTTGLAGNSPEEQAADLQAKLALLGVTGLDPDTLAAVQAAILASPDDGSGIDTLAELQTLADKAKAAQLAINAYADTNSGTPPTVQQYADIGVTGMSPDNTALLEAVNASLASTAVTKEHADTPQEVQTIVDAYARILAAADGGANPAAVLPTAADYLAVGVSPAPAEGSSELSLLNQVVDKAQTAAVGTPAALSELADTIARLMTLAAGGEPDPALSKDELSALGVTGLTDKSLAAVLKAIEATADDGSGVDTLSELQVLADNAKVSLERIEAYAQNNSGTPPSQADYRNVGLVSTADDASVVPLVNSSNLGAINSALATAPVTGEKADTPQELEALILAYNAVLAAADGGTDRPADGTLSAAAQALTPEHFSALGVTGVTPALLPAVQALIDAMPSEQAKSAANLQAAVDAITKISLLADGKAAGTEGNTPAAAVTAADITAAGVTLTNSTVASAVSSALDGLNFSQVDSPEKLQAVVNAYAKILGEANEVEPALGQSYGNKDDTPDASASDPTAADFAAIGASVAGVTNGAADAENLSLLNDALKRKAASQVDTVAELNAIGVAVQAIMEQAALPASTIVAPLSEADKQKWVATFQALGLTGLDLGNSEDVGNVQEVLSSLAQQADDGRSVDTVAEIQALVDAINASLKVITDYALSNTNRVPTVTDYANAGIKTNGVALVNATNLTAINNAVDRLNVSDVDTRAKIRSVANAYTAILDFANGSAADSATKPTEAQYRTIGVNLDATSIALVRSGVTDAPAFSLFTDAVGAQQDAGVDSPAKIEALAATAGDILRQAREVPTDGVKTPLTLARLQGLGLFPSLSASTDAALNDTKVAAFLDAVKATDNSGAGVDTLAEVQALANAVNTILNHAADAPGAPVPLLSHYADMGATVPVTAPATAANVLAALNNAVKAAAPSAVDTVAEVNALAAIVDKLMQVAAGVDPATLSPALTPADLARVGILGVETPSDLAAVLGKLASTPDDGSALADLAALQASASAAMAAQDKITAYADAAPPVPTTGPSVPTVADFEALGLVIPSSSTATQAQYLTFVQTALASTQVTGAKADTPAELQAIITAAQHVLDAANGVPEDAILPEGSATAVTRADLLALGLDPAKLTVDGTVNLLSGVIDASTADKVNTPALLEGLLDLISAVMAEAAGTGTKTDDELKAVLSQLNAIPKDRDGEPTVALDGNWAAIREAIRASKNDGTDIDTLTELRALIQKANDAQDTIRLYAAGTGTQVPTFEDYASVGLVNTAADGSITPLVTADNVAAINAALATTAIGADQASTPAQLRLVVNAYNTILDEANGPDAADANTAVNPTASDYAAIGSDVDGVTRGTANANVLSLLNSVVGNVNDAAVDTPTEINELGALANKVMAQAGNTDADRPLLTVAELIRLGVDTQGEEDGSPALEAALRVIRISPDDGSAVNTLPKLNAMVRDAIVAYNKIKDYADATAPTTLPAPTAADFLALGLVVPASVTANGGAAIAASLLTPLVNFAQVDTPAKLQALLDAYDKVLKAADGTAGNTTTANAVTAAELALIGVALGSTHDGGTDDAPKLALLQSALDAQSNTSKVDSPAEIEALNATAAALIDSAVNRSPATVTPAALSNLGLTLPAGLTQQQADAIASAIAAQGDASKVDSIAELNAIAAKALAAQAKLAAYAAADPAPLTGDTVPTLQDYLDLGLVNADGSPSVTADNLAAVNSALASSGINSDQADSPQELKAIVAAYDKVLDVATPPTTGTAPNAADYAALGLNPVPADGSTLQNLLNGFLPSLGEDAADLANVQSAGTALGKIVAAADGLADADPALTPDDLAALGMDVPEDPALAGNLAALVSAAVDAKNPADVDSLDEVQAILDAAQKLMDTAAGLPVDPALTAADLAALGIDISGKTPAEQAAILAAVGTSADDGSEVNSLADLTALVAQATTALAKIADYAAASPAPTTGAAVPTASDYKDMGVAGVTDANLAAINAALATTAVGRTQADEQPEVQAIADIYSRVLAAANDVRGDFTGTLPTAEELQKLGVNLGAASTGDGFGLLQSAIDAVARTQVDTPEEISDMAAAAARMVAAANGSSVTGTGLTLDDFTRLGVQGLDADNLAAAIDAVVAKASGEDVNSATKLQAIVDGLLRDLKVIKNYADGVANDDSTLGAIGVVLVPTLANYIGAGVTGVGDAAGQVPVAVLNAAVDALASTNVDSRAKLQAVTDAYAKVLAMADGTAGNTSTPVTSDELALIGVPTAKVPAAGSATLGLLQGALDAQAANRSTVDTPAKIGALADLAAKVVAYAADLASPPTAPAPTVADLQALGITGLSDSATATALLPAIRAAIAAADASGVDTLAEVQRMVDAAAKVRALTANGGAVDPTRPDSAELTAAEFRALGVSNAVDAPANTELLNDAIDSRPTYGSVDSPSELTELAAIVNKVIALANDEVGVSLSRAELLALGLTTTEVTLDSVSAALAAIKAKAPADVDTLAELRALVSAARDAQAKIRAYAETVADDSAPTPVEGSATVPNQADFEAMGVTGVRKDADTSGQPGNLAAVLASLATAVVNGTRAASASAVQSIVDGYNKLWAMADGTADNTTAAAAQPTAADYANIGLAAASVTQLADARVLSLLNSAIDAQPASRATIDSPAEIQALLDIVNKVLNYAKGAAVAPTAGELTQLGLTGVADLSPEALSAVLTKIAQVPDTDLSSIDTITELQTLANKAVAAQAKVADYADTGTSAAPLANDYADMGVNLPSTSSTPAVSAAVAAAILAATNAALADADVSKAEADTPAEVQKIVDAYAKILASADGVAGNTPAASAPTAADYGLVGVSDANVAKLAAPENLGLLNSLVDKAATADAAKPETLDALASAANKVMDLAAQAAGATPAAATLTDADYAALGLTGLTDIQKAAVVAAIQAKAPADVDSLAELVALADAAKASIDKIALYADNNTGAAPTVADYLNVGVTGVRDVAAGSLPANLAAINAALATNNVTGVSRVEADSPAELQAIVNSYNKILAQANGTPSDTSSLANATDFDLIGVNLADINALGADRTINAVNLLSSIVDSKQVADVDTPAEIQALAAIARKVALAVAGDTSSPLTLADFTALNIPGVKDSNLADVMTQLATLADSGADSNTWAKLADAVFSVTNVPTIQTVAGDNVINLAERTTGVTLRGTAGKDDTVQIFFPDGSSVGPIVTVRPVPDTGTSVWNWSYTLNDTDWGRLGAAGSNGETKTLQIQSRNTIKGIDSVKVDHVITLDTTPPSFTGDTPLQLQNDSGSSGSDRVTNNGTVVISGIEAGSTWEYSSNGGSTWLAGTGNTATVTGEGSQTISVRQTDAAGNLSATRTLSFTLDTLKPEAATLLFGTGIAGGATSAEATAAGALTVNAESGSAVTVVLTNRADATKTLTKTFAGTGSAANMPSLTSAELTTLGDGIIDVSVTATDVAGNVSTPTTGNFTLDTVAPNVKAVTDNVPGTARADIVFRVVLNEALTADLTTSNFTAANGTVRSVSKDSSVAGETAYFVTVAPNANLDGLSASSDVSLNLVPGTLGDAAGNALVGGSLASLNAQRVDNKAPTVSSITDNIDASITNQSVVFTVTFDEALRSAPTNANFSARNGRVTTVVPKAGDTSMKVWEVTVQPNAGVAGSDMVLSLLGSGLSDAVGNPVADVSDLTALGGLQRVDTLAPTVAGFSPVDKSNNPGAPDELPPVGSIVLTFNENIAKGTGSIIIRATSSSTGGALPADLTIAVTDPQVSVSGNKVTISPTSGLQKLTSYTVTIPSGAITDVAGNAYTGTSTYDFTTTDTNITIASVTADGVISAAENAAGFTVSGTVIGSPSLPLSAYSAGSFAVQLTGGSSPISVVIESYDASTGAWSGTVAASSLTHGLTYTVAVTATPSSGLSSTASKTFTADLSAEAPNVDLLLDSSNASAGGPAVNNTDKVSSSLALKDATNLEAGGIVEYRVKKGSGSFSDWSATYTPPTVDDTYVVEARQKDAVGNISPSTTLVLRLDTTKPATPNAALTTDSGNSAEGGTGTSSDRLTNLGGITLPTNTESGAVVQYRVKKGSSAFTDWSNSYTPPATDGSADDSYVVEVRQVDLAGNLSEVQSISYTLDTKAPVAPNVALATDSSNAGMGGSGTASDGLTNRGDLTAPTNTETGAVLQYSVKKGATGTPSSWSATYTPPATTGAADDVYEVRIRQIDRAGNVGAVQTVTYTLDTTKPGAPTISQILDNVGSITTTLTASGGRTDDTTPTVRVSLAGTSAVEGDVVDLLDAGTAVTGARKVLTAVDIGNGYVDLTPTTAQTESTHSYTARITDRAGNQGDASTTAFSLTVDTTAPIVSLFSPVDKSDAPATADELPPVGAIVLTFNEDVAKGTGTIRLTATATSSDLGVPGDLLIDVSSPEVSISGKTVTIRPNSGLQRLTDYTVTIPSGAITDVAGNAYAGRSDYNFTTTDTNIVLNAVAVDNVVNIAENAADITVSGKIVGTAAQLAAYSNDSFKDAASGNSTVTLSEGSNTIRVSGVTYNASTGDWSGTVAAGSLLHGKNYALNVTATATSSGGGISAGVSSKASKNVTTDLVAPTFTPLPITGGIINTYGVGEGRTIDDIDLPNARFTFDGDNWRTPLTSPAYQVVRASDGNSLTFWAAGSPASMWFGAIQIKLSNVVGGGIKGELLSNYRTFFVGFASVDPTTFDFWGSSVSSGDPAWGALFLSLPLIGGLALDFDSGTSKTDGVTNAGVVTVKGIEAGASWKYKVDGGSYQDGTADAKINITGEGTHTVTVQQFDAAGNPSVEQSLTFTLDTAAPTATAAVTALSADAGSSNTDFVTNVAAQTVSGTVTGTLGDGEKIQVSADGTTWVDATVTGSTWTAAGLTLVTGTGKALQVRTLDTAGNSTAGTDKAYTLDTTAPTAAATITALSADTGSSNSDFITRTAAQTVSGSFTGTLGADEKIQVSVNGTTWLDATVTGSNWTASGVTLSTGTNNLQVRTVDTAGNTLAGTAKSYTLDTTNPTLSLNTTALTDDVGSVTGAVNQRGASSNDTLPTISGTLGGATAGSALPSGETVNVYRGPDMAGATRVVGNNSSERQLSGSKILYTSKDGTWDRVVVLPVSPADGDTVVLIRDAANVFEVRDADGNVLAAGADLGGSWSHTCLAFKYDSASGKWVDAYELAGTATVTVTAGGQSTWTFQETKPLADGGDYIYAAKIVDTAGNSTAYTVGHRVTVDTSAPTVTPAITALSVDAGLSSTDFITNTAAQTVSGTFTGTLGSGENIQVSADGGTTWVNASRSGSNWTATGVTLQAGADKTLQVRAIDAAGNVTAGTAKAYTLDTTAPTAVASVTALSTDGGLSNLDFITNVAAQTVSGSFTGTLDADEKIQVSANGTTWVDATTSGSTWTAAGVTLQTGTGRSLQVRTIDTAGNTTAGANKAYTLDTTAPTAVATVTAISADTGASTSDFITNTAAQTVSGTFTGTLTLDEQVQISVNGGAWVDATVVGNTWTASGITLTGTSGNLNVRTVDTAGNATAGTGAAYTLDTVNPTASATITAISSDTGSSSTDFLTNAASQTVTGSFTGTLGEGELIQVSADGGTTWVNATATGTTGGTWSAAGVTLQAGSSRSLQARVIDRAGNLVTAPSVNYTLDTTGPGAIDLDSTAAGVQSTAVNAASNTTAVVIAPNVALATDTDVTAVRVTIAGAAVTDTLGLGSAANVTLNTTAQSGSSVTIAGVSGVNWSYSSAKVLTLSKAGGSNFTAAELQTLEKALTFTTSSSAPTMRTTFEFAHLDQAGNASSSATQTVTYEPQVSLLADTTEAGAGRIGDTATDGNTAIGVLSVTNGSGSWQYSLDGGTTWESVTSAEGTKASTAWAGVTANASTGRITLPEGSWAKTDIQVRKDAAGTASSVSGVSGTNVVVDWFTKATAQTEILVNGTTGGTDLAGDNTLVNGSTTGETLTLDHLGLVQGRQAAVSAPGNVTISLSNLSNVSFFKDGASVTSVTMKDVIDGVVSMQYSQTAASLTASGAFARADFTVSETGWNSSANLSKSLNFKFTNNRALVYGDASGNGATGSLGATVTAGIAAQGGRGGVDSLMGGSANDVIFGDGSGGGGSGSQGSSNARPGAAGGGGTDTIFGGAGDDLLFGDGYAGTNAAFTFGSLTSGQSTATGGQGGLGGGGGGGGFVFGISGSLTLTGGASLGGGGKGGDAFTPFGSISVSTGQNAQVGNTSRGLTRIGNETDVAAGGGAGVRNGGLNDNATVVEDTSSAVGSWAFNNLTVSGYNASSQIGAVYATLKAQALNNLSITGQTPGAGNDYLHGGSGNDMIAGGNGNDTIIGGQGNDILWGIGGTASGTNNDTLVWQRGDAGSTGAVDEVRDFTGWNGTSGMKIDLSGLLENKVAGSTTNLSQWITSVTTGVTAAEINNAMSAHGTSTLTQTGTKIVIDVDGFGSGSVTQTIYLRNFTAATTNLDSLTAANSWLVV